MKIKVSWIFPVAAGVTVFLLLGNFLENSEYFRPLRSTLRSRSVPTGMLNYGALGKNLKRMERILAVPNDFQRFPKSGRASIDRNANIFQKKRLVTDRLFISNPRGAAGFPSTRMMAGKTFHKGWPVISIAVDKDFLYDEKTGILTNFTKRGREWEKLAYVSYFEDGNLLFASGCGLRLHGGSSRWLGRHFRLYFREDYGANQFQPGVLFSPEAQPIKRVVVHYDWPDETPFVSCLAYDIARRMGCDAPEAKPALLYFNGNPRGLYFVSEHVGRKQWESHVGHSRFLFRRYRAVSDAESEKGFDKLKAWSLNPHVRMTMEEAAKHVDLDKLTRNLLSYAFCATDDWKQGAAVLDKTKTVPQWYWVNWDMDRSFFFQTPHEHIARKGRIWEKVGLERILNPASTEPRSVVCLRLLNESPRYRRYFIRLLQDLLNHRLNDRFFRNRIRYYSTLAASYRKKMLKPVGLLREFLSKRPRFMRKEARDYFGLKGFYFCEITAPPGAKLKIDGYWEDAPYNGWYFEGFPVTAEIMGASRKSLSYWLVNGKQIAEKTLRLPVVSQTSIRAVFR